MTNHVLSQKGTNPSPLISFINSLKFPFFPQSPYIFIKFPSDSSFAPISLTYDLIGVSNHFGNVGFGHYTACTLNPVDQSWYEFNDSTVTKITDQNKIVAEEAYLLVYRRRENI
jgi:ubiquitin C-terminal hydrolase